MATCLTCGRQSRNRERVCTACEALADNARGDVSIFDAGELTSSDYNAATIASSFD